MRKKGILLKAISSVLIATMIVNTVPVNTSGKETVYAAEDREAYGTEKTIHLHTAGGQLASLTKEVVVGEPYGTLPTPVREGYVFEGWYDKNLEGVRVNETTTVLSAVNSLYAYWTPISVRVDLYGNGAEKFEDTSISVTYGRTFVDLPELKRENYEFEGWYTAYSGGKRIANDSLVEFTSNTALYAQWRGKVVEVSFDAQSAGKTIESIKVEYGKAYGELPYLSKEGHVFAGWYLAENGSTEIGADTLVTEKENHVLYARWEKEGYKIELDTNAGHNATVETKSIYADEVYGTLPTPSRTGYTFLGWYASVEENAQRITSDMKLRENKSHTLYAKWSANQYDVLLVSGIEGEKNYELTVTYGELYDSLPVLQKENYNFLGWYTQPEGGEKVEKEDTVTITSDAVLYAQWEGNSYTVMFDSNGGKEIDSKTVTYGTTYGTLTRPTKTGYDFGGWADAPNNGNLITKNETVRLKADQKLYAMWNVKMPIITLNANGGTMVCDKEVVKTYDMVCEYGSEYGTLPRPEREGYTFAGWFTSSSAGTEVTASSKVTATVSDTLYAHWIGKEYEVYYSEGTDSYGNGSKTVVFGKAYGELPVLEFPYEDFLGWYTEPEGGTRLTSTSTVKISRNHTLYARFNGMLLHINFDSNGAAVTPNGLSVRYRNILSGMPSVSRTGYEFLGWYTEPSGGEQIKDGMTVTFTEDMTVYAHWKAKESKISFDANGGTVSTKSKTVVYGQTYGSLPSAKREGYTFLGWYTSTTGSSAIFSYDTVKITTDKTYYARWEANTYTVTLNCNGGTATTTSKEVTFGKTYGTLPSPKRTGYTFAGWYDKNEYGTKKNSSSTVEIAGNHTLYAKWKQEIFTVTFNACGGTVAIPNVAVTNGLTFRNFPTPYKEGYHFIGWYTSSTSGTKVTSISVTDTLYAHWEGNTYQVKFEPLGGTFSSGTSGVKSVVFGETYGTMPTVTKYGYTLSGWYTKETSGSKRTASTEVSQAEDHTLYARWKGVTAKVNYDVNGGKNITTTKSVTYGSEYGTLSTTSRTGYTFLGWYTAKTGGELVTSDSIVENASAHTLYAHWEVAKPTITFSGNGGKVIGNTVKDTSIEEVYTYGVAYGDLPTATRTGYQFLGWYTLRSGGTKITADTICEATTSDTFYAQWKGREITIFFDANGGETETKSKVVNYSGTYDVLPVPVKEGYTFEGWYTKKFGGEKVDEDTAVETEETQTLYAHWEVTTYKLTLDGNGGKSTIVGSDGNTSSVEKRTITVSHGGTYAGTMKRFPKFYRSGYDFVGFCTEDGIAVTADKAFTYNANQTLYAQWKQKSVIVTLNDNGADSIGKTIEVLFGGTYGELPVLSRVGYTFDGWAKTESSTSRVLATTNVSSRNAHTLYAQWIAKQYTVTFDANGGSTGTALTTVAYDALYGTLPTPTRTGYKFEGWYTQRDGGIKITSGSTVSRAENSTLYAHWTRGAYQITFNANSGTVSTSTKQVESGKMYGELPAAKRTGYDFTGWYTARSGGEKVDETDEVILTGNQTLYAQWKVKTPNVWFYANGGNLETGIKTVQYSESYGTLPVPVLEHYTFEGWYTQPYNGSRVTENTTVSETGTHTLYARWKPLNMVVRFNADGGSVTLTEKSVSYEQVYGDLPYPSREGYIFGGWHTEENGGTYVTEKTIVKATENHTLYAHWTKEKSTLKFNVNGGDYAIDTRQVLAGEAYGELPVPVREGYLFLGWFTEKTGGNKVEATDIIPDESVIILYAHWQSEKLLVTFDAMGGSVETESKNVIFGKEYGVLPVPKKTGYRFVAWYSGTNWQNKVESETIVETSADHTLYAYYVEDAVEADKAKGAVHFGAEGVNPASGNISFSCTDMVINLGGLSYTIGRTYNSKNEDASVFGKGWTFSFEGKYSLNGETAVIYLPDGSMHIFRETENGYVGETGHERFEVNADGSAVMTKEDRSKYGFHEDGTLAYTEDRYGNRTTVSHENGVVSKIVDPVGRVYEIATDAQGYITNITDPMGNAITYAYNEENYLTAVTNLLGGVTKYEYDENGVLVRIIDPNGEVIQDFSYTEEGKISQNKDVYGGEKQFTYDSENNRTLITDGDGREWIYWYNSDMYITDVQNPDGSMTKTEYVQNPENCYYGDVKSSTDEYGNKTEYECDENGNITKITYCDGSTIEKTYDQWNNCVAQKDENDVYTYYHYDEEGIKLLKTVQRVDGEKIDGTSEKIDELLSDLSHDNPDYVVNRYTYYTEEEANQLFECNLTGLVKSETNAEGETVSYTYDSYGNTVTITDAAGNVTKQTYDILGHVLTEVTPKGDVLRWEYAPDGNVTRSYYPDGGIDVFEYDLVGNLVQSVSPELYYAEHDAQSEYVGEEGIHYAYSLGGRLLEMTDVLGSTIRYAYDCNGNVITESREGAEVISYEYDNRNRLIRESYQETSDAPSIVRKEFFYETMPDGKSKETAYVYQDEESKIIQVTVKDSRGRKKETYLQDGDEKANLKVYEYYPNGTVKSVTESGNTTSYCYNAQGNLTEEYVPILDGNGTTLYKKTVNVYDRAGRVLKSSVYAEPVAGNATAFASRRTITYDTLYTYEEGYLVTKTEPEGGVYQYTYDADGNVIRVVYGNGTVADGTAMVTETTYDFRKNPLTETVYVRTEDLVSSEDLLQDVTAIVTTYEYDKEGRVVKQISPDNLMCFYAYDAAGNRVSEETPVYDAAGEYIGTAKVNREYNSRGQVQKVTDELGAETRYTYDNRGNLTKVQDALGGITLYRYNYYDQKIAEVLPGNYLSDKSMEDMVRTEYSYDALGRVEKQTEYRKNGEILEGVTTKTYHYNEEGRLVKTSDAYGHGTVYTYHPNGQIATEISAAEQQKPDGDIVSYVYDVYGNKKELHSKERDVAYEYDANGRLLAISDNLGEKERYYYNELGQVVVQADGNGNETSYTYNGLGEISSETLPGDASIGTLTTYFKYDVNGRKRVVYDTVGNRTEYTYDSLGNLTEQSVIDANTGESVKTSYRYDLASNQVEQTDALNTTTKYTYDKLGRLKQESVYVDGIEANPKTTSYWYDANGNCIEERDYLGNSIISVYDDRNRLTAQYDPLGNLISANTYDDNGRQLTATDALGNMTRYAYDANGNVTVVTDPRGAVSIKEYDADGNVVRESDPLRNQTIYEFDARNRLVGVRTPMGENYTYVYDGVGNMLVQQDGAGNRIAYTFNVRNLETSRQDIGSVEEPALNTPKEVYIYTADGKLLQKTDRNGIPTNYTYDGLGRLVSEKAGNEEKQYGYDAAGNLLFMRNGADITRRTYDAEGRVVSKTVDGIGTVTYQYDIPMGAGAVKEITTAPDGSVTETVYDAVGRVSQVSGSRGETVHYVYNANGSCQATVYEDGTREDYVYDASGNVLTVKHTDRYGTLLDAYEYEYDIAGNLTKETSQYGTTTYVYDADCRLQSVTEPEGKTITYSYDMAGNRARKEVSNPGSVPIVTEYTYNMSNQLLKQHTSDGSVTEYTYDANGNLIYEEIEFEESTEVEEVTGAVSGSAIEIPVRAVSGSAIDVSAGAVTGSAIEVSARPVTGSAIRYTYDAFNRLTEYSDGDVEVEYSYNADDYRVGKRVVDTNGVEVIQYFYEGAHVLFETDGTGSITAYNLYGNHLISRSVQGEQYYYLYNAHGDVVMLVDADSGAVAATYRYDAFGNLMQQTGDVDNNITYAGYQYDEETGLYYLNARYYNSNTGRFLTEDTYRGRQQDPLSLHRYTYCHNNPLNYYDPSGHNAASIEAEFSWLRDVDGPYPYGDMVYFLLFGVAFIATSGTIDIPIKFGGEPYTGPSPETELYPAPQKPIEFAGETYSESSHETGQYPAPCPAPQPVAQSSISINADGNIGTIVDPIYDGIKLRRLWFPIVNARMHILVTPQYNDEPIWVLKDPVIENSGPQIMVDPIPYDTSIHIYQSNKGTDKSNGGDTGSGAYQSGKTTIIPDKAKDIAKQVKDNNGAPPKGYKGGRTYKNIPLEEGAQKLPEGVNYREYDINPYVKGQNRGPERIVIGDDNSVWYTNDHYYTFTQIE